MRLRAAGCAWLPLAGVAIVVATFVGWRWGDRIFPRVERWVGVEAEVDGREKLSPELAQSTVERVEALQRASEPGELAVGAVEVASVLRYAAPGVVPEGIAPPEIELDDGRMVVSSRVATAAFPRVPELERVVGILPDTVPVRLDASLIPFGEEGVALIVHRIRLSGIPLPRRLTPVLLRHLGRVDVQGLPPDAMVLPLPRHIRTAYIHLDSLILLASPR